MAEEEEKKVAKEKVASTGGVPLLKPPSYLNAKPSKHRLRQTQKD